MAFIFKERISVVVFNTQMLLNTWADAVWKSVNDDAVMPFFGRRVSLLLITSYWGKEIAWVWLGWS